MAISFGTKVIIATAAICFAAILITVTVVVENSHEERNKNKSMILIYWLKCM